MTKTFVEQMYAQTSEYALSISVTQSATIMQVESMKQPGLRKSTVIYLADMPLAKERDEYLKKKLIELTEKVKAGESR